MKTKNNYSLDCFSFAWINSLKWVHLKWCCLEWKTACYHYIALNDDNDDDFNVVDDKNIIQQKGPRHRLYANRRCLYTVRNVCGFKCATFSLMLCDSSLSPTCLQLVCILIQLNVSQYWVITINFNVQHRTARVHITSMSDHSSQFQS